MTKNADFITDFKRTLGLEEADLKCILELEETDFNEYLMETYCIKKNLKTVEIELEELYNNMFLSYDVSEIETALLKTKEAINKVL